MNTAGVWCVETSNNKWEVYATRNILRSVVSWIVENPLAMRDMKFVSCPNHAIAKEATRQAVVGSILETGGEIQNNERAAKLRLVPAIIENRVELRLASRYDAYVIETFSSMRDLEDFSRRHFADYVPGSLWKYVIETKKETKDG